MRLPIYVVMIVLLVFAAVAALNWGALTAPVAVDLLVTTVQLPAGLIMLGALALVAALLLGQIIYLQSLAVRDARRHNKSLQSRLDGVDSAVAAQVAELRGCLGEELNRLSTRMVDAEARLKQQMGMVGEDLRSAVQTSGNGVAASIAELEDRLERAHVVPPSGEAAVLPGEAIGVAER